MTLAPHAMGRPMDRVDGPDKVRGLARYAYEYACDRPAYAFAVEARIAVGRITDLDTSAAEAVPGVLAVLTCRNAPRIAADFGEYRILQSDRVAFRNQMIGAVVAETSEIARYAAELVRVAYQEEPHDVELRADHPGLYRPAEIAPQSPMDTERGDVDAALAAAPVTVDATYRTARYQHNTLEPHTTIALWADDRLTLYVSSQMVYRVQQVAAAAFGLSTDRIRVVSQHIGGAFGSKVTPRADLILAIMAARAVPGRPVRFALTRQQTFSQTGHRSPTIQRVQLGADPDGRLSGLAHGSIERTSTLSEFAEHATRMLPVLYAGPNRRTTQRIVKLDLPTPSIMRAPGEAAGMVALESAMDELAVACGVDPVELRIRNDTAVHPMNGMPFSSRNLVACLREGAHRFGWERRDPTPRARLRDGWWVGTGVAASTYAARRNPGSRARIVAHPGGRYSVQIAAADIGTGARTALLQIAADALDVETGAIELGIGDTAYPFATPAGGSTGLASWGSAIVEAARRLRDAVQNQHSGTVPAAGLTVEAPMPEPTESKTYATQSFGAQFAEARVNAETGEVRVPRLLGVFAVGRVVNAKTAHSQLIGGMTMGLSMALHEDAVMDGRFGHVVNHDLAQYHIATNADVGTVEAYWVDEDDRHVSPMGAKGLGEIGIVGTPAAIANAVYHATGIRVRDLPITLDKLLPGL